MKGNTVDGGEHQRHAARDSHQTVDTIAVGKQNSTADSNASNNRQDGKQTTGINILQEECTDETAQREEHHSDDIELLRQNLRSFLVHTFSHEYARTILDNKGPARHLSSYVEELGYYTLAVVPDMPQLTQGCADFLIRSNITILRHLHQTDGHKERYHNYTQEDIGHDEHT